MRSKVQDREKAIQLRKQGKSYREIMAVVPVAKSSLSKWFTNLPLTKREEKFLRERALVLQDNGRLKTALLNKERNEKRRDRIRVKAKIDFERYRNDPFFVLGLALYWAEGAKKNSYFSFINSDVMMMKIMMRWVGTYLLAEPMDYKFRLYIHKVYAHEKCEQYWSRNCGIPYSQFQKTVYKPTLRTEKKNPDYKGCLRFTIMGVHHLIAIKTWQNCLSEYYVEAK